MQRLTIFAAIFLTTACAAADEQPRPFAATPIAQFNEPWAMTFLPDGRLLVTEKPGRLFIVTQRGDKSAAVSGCLLYTSPSPRDS